MQLTERKILPIIYTVHLQQLSDSNFWLPLKILGFSIWAKLFQLFEFWNIALKKAKMYQILKHKLRIHAVKIYKFKSDQNLLVHFLFLQKHEPKTNYLILAIHIPCLGNEKWAFKFFFHKRSTFVQKEEKISNFLIKGSLKIPLLG